MWGADTRGNFRLSDCAPVKEVVIDKKYNKNAPIGSRTRVHRLGSDDDNRYTIGALHPTTTNFNLCTFILDILTRDMFHNGDLGDYLMDTFYSFRCILAQ